MMLSSDKQAKAQKKLQGSIAKAPSPSLFSRLFRRGAMKAIIGEKRERCCVVGVMVLVDKSIPLDGMVMDIGTGGATFRPASTYILDRGRSEVLLRFAERELRGKIAGVSPKGYDIAFNTAMPGNAVQDVLREFGEIPGSASAARAA